GDGLLLDERDAAGTVPTTHAAQVGPGPAQLTGAAGRDPGDHPQQARLARTVRPQQAADPAAWDGHVHTVEDQPAVDPPAGRVDPEPGHRAPPASRRRHSSQANSGAPMNAVRMPTGSSRGAKTVRAAVSAQIRNEAPIRAE